MGNCLRKPPRSPPTDAPAPASASEPDLEAGSDGPVDFRCLIAKVRPEHKLPEDLQKQPPKKEELDEFHAETGVKRQTDLGHHEDVAHEGDKQDVEKAKDHTGVSKIRPAGESEHQDHDCCHRTLGRPMLKMAANTFRPKEHNRWDHDCSWTRDMLEAHFTPMDVNEDIDLRRYLGCMDILVVKNSNIWGHVIMVLDNPTLLCVPSVVDETPEHNVIAEWVPCFVMRTLESASDYQKLLITQHAVIRHPVSNLWALCSLTENRDAVELWPAANTIAPDVPYCYVDGLLSPLNQQLFDEDVFRLCVDEARLSPQDTMWSVFTAVVAFLRSGTLDQESYSSLESKLQLAMTIENQWAERPICSSIPPRVWQKYLLKRSYKLKGEQFDKARCAQGSQEQCHCSHGDASAPSQNKDVKGSAFTHSAHDDPDIAWVEDVLKVMPVKDDRVMPAELTKALCELAPSLWTPFDVSKGPPKHRSEEFGGPPKSTFFTRRPLCMTLAGGEATARKALPDKMTNFDGARVNLGEDGFSLYCGRKFDEPQSVSTTNWGGAIGPAANTVIGDDGYFQWDGCCGPLFGPQCEACRRTEDRLYM